MGFDTLPGNCSHEPVISLDTAVAAPREAGVVYTKPWMVELVLDLAGYLPEKRLVEIRTGMFSDVSEMSSLKNFVASFAGHIAAEAAR